MVLETVPRNKINDRLEMIKLSLSSFEKPRWRKSLPKAGRKSINVWDSDSSVRGHMENIVDAIGEPIYI